MKFTVSSFAAATLFSLLHSATALPAQSANTAYEVRNTLSKRAEPQIPDTFTGPDADKVDSSFADVIEMLKVVLGQWDQGQQQKIFPKYFADNDKNTIFRLFNQIVGGRRGDGNKLLGTIFVQNDDPTGDCQKGSGLAYTTEWDTDEPTIHMCARGIAQPKLCDVQCEDLGDTVSEKMMTVAGTLLHEYTHYNQLTEATAGGEIEDFAYGPQDCMSLDKAKAKFNADSYAYFASEVWFSFKCNKDFNLPISVSR